jgi:hypothetical protein
MNQYTKKAIQDAIDFFDESYEAHKIRKALQYALEQPAQEPISFEMDELTEEYYGVLDDKTAIMIYGGNRKYWSNKIYPHPKQLKRLSDDEIYKCQHPEYPDTMYFAHNLEKALALKNGMELSDE